jgi:hypothetical protein
VHEITAAELDEGRREHAAMITSFDDTKKLITHKNFFHECFRFTRRCLFPLIAPIECTITYMIQSENYVLSPEFISTYKKISLDEAAVYWNMIHYADKVTLEDVSAIVFQSSYDVRRRKRYFLRAPIPSDPTIDTTHTPVETPGDETPVALDDDASVSTATSYTTLNAYGNRQSSSQITINTSSSSSAGARSASTTMDIDEEDEQHATGNRIDYSLSYDSSINSYTSRGLASTLVGMCRTANIDRTTRRTPEYLQDDFIPLPSSQPSKYALTNEQIECPPTLLEMSYHVRQARDKRLQNTTDLVQPLLSTPRKERTNNYRVYCG